MPAIVLASIGVACTVVLVLLWPAFTLIGGIALGIVVLAWRRPAYGLIAALLFFAAEGSVKILLTDHGTPFPATGRAVGAVLLDAVLVVAVIALVIANRELRFRPIWLELGYGGRVAAVLLGCWLAISFLQSAQSGDIVRGLAGYRLTQGYVFLFAAGALVFAGPMAERSLRLLIGALAVVTSYAGVRAIVGPSESERAYATAQAGVTEFEQGEIFRAVGSFSGAVGLVSFLVPAGVFAFVVGVLRPGHRILASVVVTSAVAGIIGSYVRSAFVALSLGIAVGVAMIVLARGVRPQGKLLAAAAAVVVIAAGAVAVASAGRASEETQQRAGGIVTPGRDPSVKQRIDTWRESLRQIRSHPWGTGLGTVGHASAHDDRPAVTTDNSYLKVFREQGILVGFVFLSGLALAMAVIALRLLHSHAAVIGIAALAAFIAFMALAFVGEYVEQPGKVLAWTLLGVAAAQAFRPALVRTSSR